MKTFTIHITLILLMLLTSQSFSATINVPDPNHLTIQEGIDAAGPGDIVLIASGTYNEAINFNGKSITVRSATGNPADVTINGTGHFHVVQCINGEDPNTVLEGVTITGGNANGGGVNSVGGGMRNVNSSPTVTRCVFSGNQAANGGGGMFNVNSSPTVTYCVFSGNTAATNNGAGMHNIQSSPLVTHCIFSGNAANAGGGMGNEFSSPTVTHSVFSGNTGNIEGGGMLNEGSFATVTNCVFSGNATNGNGGGIILISDFGLITNSTFVNNVSGMSGGGLYITGHAAFCTVISSIFWQNSDSGGMDTSSQIHVDGGNGEVRYSNVMGGWTGLGTGNINADPLFVDADGPDDDPNTPADNNLRLSLGSPCIDAGNSSVLPVGVVIDLDGNPRQLDDPFTVDTGVGFPTVDMGAYEFDFSIPCQLMNKGDLNCDGIINIFDFALMSANWLVSQ